MDSLDYSAASLILVFGIVLVVMLGYPFGKAGLLHLSTRLLKFQQRSYWKSFFSILIGIGALMFTFSLDTAIIGYDPAPQSITVTKLLLVAFTLIVAPIAEAISVLLFFKQSVGKTIGAVVLTHVFIVVLFILLLILLFIVALFAGLLGANT